MKFFIDTEFHDTGTELDLISIGIYCENGKTYYAEALEFNFGRASQWLHENVIPHLDGNKIPRDQMRQEIIEFVNEITDGDMPEFWCYYGAWDWLLFARVVSPTGLLINMPRTWPQRFRELCDYAEFNNALYLINRSSNKLLHNALSDAEWTFETYKRIEDYVRNERRPNS